MEGRSRSDRSFFLRCRHLIKKDRIGSDRIGSRTLILVCLSKKRSNGGSGEENGRRAPPLREQLRPLREYRNPQPLLQENSRMQRCRIPPAPDATATSASNNKITPPLPTSPATIPPPLSFPSTTSSSCVTAPAPLVPTEEPASSATASAEQPQLASNGPSRCAACRKRVGLSAGFQCRCGATFCGAHRYPERHACGFDYKAAGREAIARANPLVRADKLRRI
uniref:AN1-type domain-containing protein n=1 Tax=Ananas comosus var. bracteatus TaxID=296719 RepID=A0A6V7NHK4_ANACO|nr:unnamed protein product [Ananas comosus var. bracteatus]